MTTATRKSTDNRISLYRYTQGIAYMSGVNLQHVNLGKNREVSREIMTCPKRVLNSNLLNLLSEKLNVSVDSLKDALNGDKKPLDNLLSVSKVTGQYKELSNFLAHLTKPQMPKPKATKKRSHSKTKNKPRRKMKISASRANLRNYIRALAFMKDRTLTAVAKAMGIERTVFNNDIVRSAKDSTVLTKIKELPYVLDINPEQFTKDTKAILNGDTTPMARLEKRYLNGVAGKGSLLEYVKIVLLLHNTDIYKMSRKLDDNKSGKYLQNRIMINDQDELADIFTKVSKILGIKGFDFQTAITKANLNHSAHSYNAHMKFYISYNDAPVDYHEPDFKKRKSINKANTCVLKIRSFTMRHRKSIYRYYKHFNAHQYKSLYQQHNYQAHIRKYVGGLISAWSFLYNFDYNKFLSTNFRDFKDDDSQVAVLENNVWVPIKDSLDWWPILHRIQLQLQAIRGAKTLGNVQRSVYAPYVNVSSIFSGELSNPKSLHYNQHLAVLDPKKRYKFIGRFYTTAVGVDPKSVDNSHPGDDFRIPQLIVRNVRRETENVKVPVALRLSLNYGKRFAHFGHLRNGDEIEFKAYVVPYRVGNYRKNSVPTIDYKLKNAYPTFVNYHTQRDVDPVPTETDALTGYCFKNSRMMYDKSTSNYRHIRHCLGAYRKWQQNIHRQGTNHTRHAKDIMRQIRMGTQRH